MEVAREQWENVFEEGQPSLFFPIWWRHFDPLPI